MYIQPNQPNVHKCYVSLVLYISYRYIVGIKTLKNSSYILRVWDFSLQRLPLGCSLKWTVPSALVFSTCLTSHWWVFGKPTKTDVRKCMKMVENIHRIHAMETNFIIFERITSQEFTFCCFYTVVCCYIYTGYYRYCFNAFENENGVFSTKRVALL